MTAHTPGPWFVDANGKVWRRDPRDLYENGGGVAGDHPIATAHRGWSRWENGFPVEANARLIAAAPDLLEALHEGRRAIGDHHAPNDCYATGPLTGDEYRDLVQCPACSFIAMYDAAIAKAKGEQP